MTPLSGEFHREAISEPPGCHVHEIFLMDDGGFKPLHGDAIWLAVYDNIGRHVGGAIRKGDTDVSSR